MSFEKIIKNYIENTRIKSIEAIENANFCMNNAKIEYQIAKKDANLYYNRELRFNCDLHSLKEETYQIYWNKCYEDNRKALKEARSRVKNAEKSFRNSINDIKRAERKLALLNWLLSNKID